MGGYPHVGHAAADGQWLYEAIPRGYDMSNRGPYIAAGVVVAVIALWIIPGWLAWVVFAAIIGVPVVAYLTLDRSQRRRIRNINRRRLP